MLISIAVVRRETAKALQVILAEKPHRIHWLPKKCVRPIPKAGDRDVSCEVADWIVNQWKENNDEPG